jgi:hypothetical protein
MLGEMSAAELSEWKAYMWMQQAVHEAVASGLAHDTAWMLVFGPLKE